MKKSHNAYYLYIITFKVKVHWFTCCLFPTTHFYFKIKHGKLISFGWMGTTAKAIFDSRVQKTWVERCVQWQRVFRPNHNNKTAFSYTQAYAYQAYIRLYNSLSFMVNSNGLLRPEHWISNSPTWHNCNPVVPESFGGEMSKIKKIGFSLWFIVCDIELEMQ